MSAPSRVLAPARAVSGREAPGRSAGALGPATGRGELPGRGQLEPALALEAIFAFRSLAWLRRVPGRETLAWPDPGGEFVLKRFLGDDAREAWWDLLHLRRARSPGRREAENLEALAADGLPVPRAVGWWEERNPGGGWTAHRFGRSAVVMERVEHGEHLRALLEREPALAAHWAQPVAALAAGLHARGWYHRDLYLQHLIPLAGERLVLLDVGRARRQRRPRRRWFAKDLAALAHSAPASVGARDRLR
ncbi:MAG TPA: lipopolysaccharide kinase InaA family protein, partial [Planctomycetota bacterium]|nr:lipopolysaccharide kinase InaA family protein [Planctomycetota bacterium]